MVSFELTLRKSQHDGIGGIRSHAATISAFHRAEPIEIRREAATVPDTGISTRSALEHQ
jgi:hypothetical protein